MLSFLDSATSARPSTPLTTFDLLETELRDQAHMLYYLPYDKADFFDQNDEPDAVPLRLRYGQLKSSAKEYAFILLYPAPSLTTSPSTKVFIYDSNDALKEQIPAMNIGKLATPDPAFDGLVQQHKVLAVAKFYFMKRGVDMKFPVPISKTFKDSVLAACISIKKTMDEADEAAVGTVPLGAKHRMIKSEQPRLSRGLAFPFRLYQQDRGARHKLLSQELSGSEEEDGSITMDTTIMTQAMVVKPPKNYSPEICQELKENMMKTPMTKEKLLAMHSIDGSPGTVVGRIQTQTPQNILDPNTQTAGPKKYVPGNPPQQHHFFAPALDMRKYTSDTGARKSRIPTETSEKQMRPKSPKSRQTSAVHNQPDSELVTPNNLIAQLRQFKASKAELRTNSAQHEKDVKSMAENREALEAKKVALEKEENALVLREAALKKHETELSDKQKRSQQEAKRLREYMPQEVREWLDFVVEDEPETKRQKTG